MGKLPRIALLAGLLAGLDGIHLAAAQTNLIQDGSFENPPLANGTTKSFQLGQKMGHWMVVGTSGDVTLINGIGYSVNTKSAQAQSGKQYAVLNSPGDVQFNDIMGVEQIISTTPGTHYVLTFYLGNIYDPNSTGAMAAVNAYVDHALVVAAINPYGRLITKQRWLKFSATFTASTARTAITFINNFSAGQNTALDAVSVVGAP